MFWRNKFLLNNFGFCKPWRVIEKKFFHHERLVFGNENVTPATIGIIDGEIHVGMNEEQIHKLSNPDTKTFKCSAREICSIAAGGLNGGTTVGATVTIANLAGIAVMATGGIGGVHRNAENTFDISSDLIVMSHTPVSVETHGVPVISIGTKMFPAFYSRTTVDKIPAPMTVPGAREAARCINVQRMMKLSSGLIFAVPIPEAAALEPSEIEGLIQTALKEAESNKITGKEVTPYLLKRVKELTSGKSLSANKALIENNARVAGEIATELYNLSSQLNPAPGPKSALSTAINQKDQVVVIGGAVVDNILQVEEPIIKFDGRTNKGVSRKSFGGVARNIAASLLALGVGETKFITVVGDDQPGLEIFRSFGKNGRIKILSDINGECHFGFGEMDLLNSMEPNLVRDNRSGFEKAKLIVLDGNPSLETINEVIDIAVNCSVPGK
ncbi:Similar to psuG: Pseudouridine-5'-phosphate glycosidase (Roseobacter denitrificans (strain ATCC 33942 / OCh 114)), partial [Cotesia congregata]